MKGHFQLVQVTGRMHCPIIKRQMTGAFIHTTELLHLCCMIFQRLFV
jgi:hypothetical protein